MLGFELGMWFSIKFFVYCLKVEEKEMCLFFGFEGRSWIKDKRFC